MSEATETILAFLRSVAEEDGAVPRGAFAEAARRAGVSRPTAWKAGREAGFHSPPINRVMEHGTLSKYARGKCRCEPCRETWRVYYTDYRKRRKAEASGVQAGV